MKKKSFYLISIIIILISCSDNESGDSELKFSTEYLSESSWSGEYISKIRSSEQIYKTYDFGITFYDERKGKYTMYYKNTGSVYREGYFTYTVNNKRLSIDNSDIIGEWFLLEQKGNTITLVKDLDTGHYIDYIHVSKTY